MANDRPLLRLRLVANNLPEGEIPLAELVRIAGATQTFVRQITGNLVGQRRPGAAAKAVAGASQLSLVGLKAGSTILEIAGAPQNADYLEYDVPTDLTDITFNLLIDGVSALASKDSQDAPEMPVGYDNRLVEDLDAWLKSMRHYELVAFESRVSGKVTNAITSPNVARTRLKDVAPQPLLPFVSSSQQELSGRLYALNLNTGSFHVEDDGGHKIRTVLRTDVRDAASTLVNRRVRAVGKPELDDVGRIRAFRVEEIGPAPDLVGLFGQESFFDKHELDVRAPAGEAGTLDDWAIGGLSGAEIEEFMSALGDD